MKFVRQNVTTRTSNATPQCPTSDAWDSKRYSVSHGSLEKASFATLMSAFYHSVNLHPNIIAVRDLSKNPGVIRPKELTYAELDMYVQSLSEHLRHLGVRRDQRTLLVARQGLESVVGILAILSCGAQYSAVDDDVVSSDYLRRVVAWSSKRVILSTSSSTSCWLKQLFPGICIVNIGEWLVGTGPNIVSGDDVMSSPVGRFGEVSVNDACYTIFQSDAANEESVKHRSVVNLVCLPPGNLGIQPGMRVGQMSRLKSDLAAWEIFSSLCNGGTLVTPGREAKAALQQIDVLITTPTTLSTYTPETFPNIRIIATAGEAVSWHLTRRWAHVSSFWVGYGSPDATLVSAMLDRRPYPSTREHTCSSNYATHDPGHTGHNTLASVGNPIPNTSIYILDKKMKPVVKGYTGEIWIGAHEHSSNHGHSYDLSGHGSDSQCLYPTGDYGFCHGDGDIRVIGPGPLGESLGFDNYISLEELDRVLSVVAYAANTTSCAALVIDGQIHAYIAPKRDNEDTDNIQQIVEQGLESLRKGKQLPDRVGLQKIHQVMHLPVQENGRLDKMALHLLATGHAPREEAADEATFSNKVDLQLKFVDQGRRASETATRANSGTRKSWDRIVSTYRSFVAELHPTRRASGASSATSKLS